MMPSFLNFKKASKEVPNIGPRKFGIRGFWIQKPKAAILGARRAPCPATMAQRVQSPLRGPIIKFLDELFGPLLGHISDSVVWNSTTFSQFRL